jgi:3-oxoacyl-[acyl-carrier protein] reductase
MELGLKHKVAIITGASRGIGRATAVEFAREGAKLVITYNSDRDRAERVADELRSLGTEVAVSYLDLADHDSIHALAQAALDRWGQIDVLVNNAVQWGERAPWEMPAFEKIEAAFWRPLIQANLEGYFAAIQAVLPAMRQRSWGRIVNVSSTIANDGFVGAPHYAAAKAGVHGLTRTLAKEVGPAGILVNVVMPGLTLTEKNPRKSPPRSCFSLLPPTRPSPAP